ARRETADQRLDLAVIDLLRESGARGLAEAQPVQRLHLTEGIATGKRAAKGREARPSAAMGPKPCLRPRHGISAVLLSGTVTVRLANGTFREAEVLERQCLERPSGADRNAVEVIVDDRAMPRERLRAGIDEIRGARQLDNIFAVEELDENRKG